MSENRKQCPKCLRHKHEEVIVKKRGKEWLIDRCAEPKCRYNFDIQAWGVGVKRLTA